MLQIDETRTPGDLLPGLKEIEKDYADRFSTDTGDKLALVPDDSRQAQGYRVERTDGTVTIRYSRPIDAFRALGRLMGTLESGGKDLNFSETTPFSLLGAMYDLSRNGVIDVPAFKKIFRRLALMGVNSVGLYCEDTYEIAGEPFFGYLRGRYTHDELRELDDYGHQFGIEVFPCIQTLGHLDQILQWPAYAHLKDAGGVLIAEHEETYALVRKMIEAASAPFRSKRMHVGMDEAWGIGTGGYKRLFGEKSPFAILNQHLAKVREICLENGLQPMMWSDMYFRLGSKTGDYYDRECVIPGEVIDGIPKDVQLVYWDYYHTDREFYEDWIERHRQLGSEPVVASGVWTWDHHWTALPFSFTTVAACMEACRAKGVNEVFVTLWGDDGMECDIHSALPGIQYFTEYGYQESADRIRLHTHFLGSCRGRFDDWVKASELDQVPAVQGNKESRTNVSKWLLWQDPLLGFLDPEIAGLKLDDHYALLSEELSGRLDHNADADSLRRAAQLARVLSLKVGLRESILESYRAGDRTSLGNVAENDLPAIQREVEELWRLHRKLWMDSFKPFGWEVLEQRYGGLVFRLKTLADRLAAWATRELDRIPELETELQPIFKPDNDLPHLRAARARTPSFIK